MARLNNSKATPKYKNVTASINETVTNHKGGEGYKRAPKAELFLAAVTSLNEDSFYETAEQRNDRMTALITDNRLFEDAEWMNNFISWLRNEAGLRSIPNVLAVETVKARLDAGLTGKNREIIKAGISRLDETSDVLAYWTSKYGRNIPSAVKRGVADAINEKLNEGSFLKWRGRAANGTISLRDALNLTHAKPKDEKKNALFAAVIADGYGNKVDDSNLPVVKARKEFLALPKDELIAALTGSDSDKFIKDARLTHEVIAGAIGKIPAEVWEKLVPSMGYKALRMNLRRIEESGVSFHTITEINKVLADKKNVASSLTMPIEFLSAYRNAPMDFAGALQHGANGALENVPVLDKRTLILVDRSGSMSSNLSQRGSLNRADAANVFAVALALRAENATVVSYNTNNVEVTFKTKDLLREAEAMPVISGGTDTRSCLARAYKDHDRVIILTDEQTYYGGWYDRPRNGDVFEGIVPENVPAFTWNLAGYEASHNKNKAGSKRFTFGGLTDKGLQMIPLLEKGFDLGWPWETKTK